MSTGKPERIQTGKRAPDMTDPTIHLNNNVTGYAEVRRGYDIIGTVKRINQPHEVNGFVKIERQWEARRPQDSFVFNSDGFPTFPTRHEAINYLAEEY